MLKVLTKSERFMIKALMMMAMVLALATVDLGWTIFFIPGRHTRVSTGS